jgi:hypothetical protein
VPKRVIDADAMWSSDKLAACAEWAQAEYAWLYGLADASGSFELPNLRVIWGRVAAIRRNFTIERLEKVFEEFGARGLLFRWESSGKRFGRWTGSDVPGRLPAASWRARLEKLAPPVPRKELAEYLARFSSGPKQIAAAELSHATSQQPANMSLRELKPGLESAQAQDLNLNVNLNRNPSGNEEEQLPFPPLLSEETANASSNPSMRGAAEKLLSQAARSLDPWARRGEQSSVRTVRPQPTWWQARQDAKALQLARDLRVGRGPELPPPRAARDTVQAKSEQSNSRVRTKAAASGR